MLTRKRVSPNQKSTLADDVADNKPAAKKQNATSIHTMLTRSKKKNIIAEQSPIETIAKSEVEVVVPPATIVKLDLKYDPELNLWYGGKHPSEIDPSQVKEYPPHIHMMTLQVDRDTSDDEHTTQMERTPKRQQPPVETALQTAKNTSPSQPNLSIKAQDLETKRSHPFVKPGVELNQSEKANRNYDHGSFHFFSLGRGYMPHTVDEDSYKKSATNIELDHIIDDLAKNFPINHDKHKFNFYPFSNECYFDEILTILNKSEAKFSNPIKIALLFGESNFISMLPELSKHANLIIMADIEPMVHLHNRHLLDCLNRASSPDEFLKYYVTGNPAENYKSIEHGKIITLDINSLKDCLISKNRGVSSLQKRFFLSSQARYAQCKAAADKLTLTHAQIDLLNIEQSQLLASLLKTHNAVFALCNFTNIHHYDKDCMLKKTVPLLLENSKDTFIMYADDFLQALGSHVSRNIKDYFSRREIFSNFSLPNLSGTNIQLLEDAPNLEHSNHAP